MALRVVPHLACACAFLLALLTPLLAAPAPSSSPAPSPSPAATTPKTGNDAEALPHVNMYGPTLTNSATLTNVGLPEYELYYAAQNSCPAFVRQRQSVYLVKYTWSKHWMVLVGSNGFVRQDTLERSTSDFASPQLTLKYLFKPPTHGGDAQALELVYKPPFGDPAKGINTGQPDYQLYWIYSRPIGECSLDVNVWLGSLGVVDGARRLTLSQSAALTVPVTEALNYLGEVYHLGGNGPIPSVVSTLHGVTYEVSGSFEVGMAVDFGLNASAPRVNYVVGAAFFIGGGSSTGKASHSPWNPMRQVGTGTIPFGR